MGRLRRDPGLGGRRGRTQPDRPGRRTSCRLVSIEDDARDERLRVVWELERGAVAHDQHALPSPADGFDDPAQLDAFLDAVRWGAIASADKTVLQAPFRSGIQIEDYQLDPVVRALSDAAHQPADRRRRRAGQDHRGRPGHAGADAALPGPDDADRLPGRPARCSGATRCGTSSAWTSASSTRRCSASCAGPRGLYANPWTHYPRLIVSIDWLKRDRPMRLLREVLPAGAEVPAHASTCWSWTRCTPARRPARGKYAVDSLRTQAIRTLAPHCEHRLFLSATPHNGYLESFTALLELLDDQRFARGRQARARSSSARIMVRRLKRDLPPKWDGTPRFPRRVTQYLEVEHSAEERRGAPAADRVRGQPPQGGRRRAGRARRRLRHHAAEEAAVLLAEGVRRDDRDAPAHHDRRAHAAAGQ